MRRFYYTESYKIVLNHRINYNLYNVYKYIFI
jgi:hypothetical protein